MLTTLLDGNSPHTHAAVNLKNDSRALAFGFISSKATNIELQNNQSGPAEGSINFLSFGGAYATKFGSLAVGITAQYLREEFYVYNANGFAVNFGMGGHLWNNRLRLGTSLLNLGKMNEAGNGTKLLPTLIRTGYDAELITFIPPQNDDLSIIVNLKMIGFSLYPKLKVLPLRNRRQNLIQTLPWSLTLLAFSLFGEDTKRALLFATGVAV